MVPYDEPRMTKTEEASSAMQAIPFENLIGAPLNACVLAQKQAAEVTYDYINAVGFKENGTDSPTTATVSFSFISNGVYSVITVPLLTIVPIPYIKIDSIDVAFKANVYVDENMRFKAKVATEQTENKSQYNLQEQLDIKIHASSSDMPAGLAKMLEIFNSCIDIDQKTQSEIEAEANAKQIEENARKESDKLIEQAIKDIEDKKLVTFEKKENKDKESQPKEDKLSGKLPVNEKPEEDGKENVDANSIDNNIEIPTPVHEEEIKVEKDPVVVKSNSDGDDKAWRIKMTKKPTSKVTDKIITTIIKNYKAKQLEPKDLSAAFKTVDMVLLSDLTKEEAETILAAIKNVGGKAEIEQA